MFSTLKQKLLLGVFIFILLSIPVGSYLVSQNQTYKSKAAEFASPAPTLQVPPRPSASPAAVRELLTAAEEAVLEDSPEATASPSPSPASPEIATSYGPTLSFKAKIEGRPEADQATRLFVGIMEGSLTANPRFLLSFTVDLPASGAYSNLSLAGLNPGSRYSALLKGTNQIATSSAFTMTPAVSNLNEGEPLTLSVGDLNDDNVINSADYSIAVKAFGTTTSSAGWNANIDFNSDGMINTFDLSILTKNIGQTGASGAWTSPIPKVATASAGLSGPPVGSPEEPPGHWIWVPNIIP